MDINFNAPVGNVIQVSGDNNEIFLDNSKKVVQTMQSQQPATQHPIQAEVVEDIVPVTTDQPTVQYSQYLIRGANPLKSDDEVQRNFVNAAKSGPSALVDYLLTAEGKLSFNVFAVKPSVFINTVNKECGTNISVKSYETAKYRRM